VQKCRCGQYTQPTLLRSNQVPALPSSIPFKQLPLLIKTKRSFGHDLSTLGFRVSSENTNSRVWIRAAGGKPKRVQRHLLDLHTGEAVGDGGVLLHLGLLGAERVVGEGVHVHHRRRRAHHLLLLLLSSLRELPHELRRSPEAPETRLLGRWVGPGWEEALRRV
jgi:hypothetical protein